MGSAPGAADTAIGVDDSQIDGRIDLERRLGRRETVPAGADDIDTRAGRRRRLWRRHAESLQSGRTRVALGLDRQSPLGDESLDVNLFNEPRRLSQPGGHPPAHPQHHACGLCSGGEIDADGSDLNREHQSTAYC